MRKSKNLPSVYFGMDVLYYSEKHIIFFNIVSCFSFDCSRVLAGVFEYSLSIR